MAALEQQALQERRHGAGGGQPSQAQQAQRHVPVFRSRAFQQQALPAGTWPAAEGIEEPDSDEDASPPAAGAAAAGAAAAPAAASAQRPAAGAVPQLGRRGALPLAGQAAAQQAPASDQEQEGEQGTPAATTQGRRNGQQAPVAAGAAGAAGGGQPAVQVDFSSLDVEALRPSVLLR